jgi:DNA-binding NarL/FixJ family response regulator
LKSAADGALASGGLLLLLGKLIVMPDMSSIEATYEIRRVVPETKVLLISSYYNPEEAAYLSRLFGDGNFIQKSEVGKELILAISQILNRG